MIELEYNPKLESTDEKYGHVWIGWNEEIQGKNMHEVIILRKNSLYNDLMSAKTRIAGMLSTWIARDMYNICVHVPDSLTSQSSYVLEHVLSKIINEIFPPLYTKKTLRIIVSGRHTTRLQKAVDIVSKTLGARMLAMIPGNVATPEFFAKQFNALFNRVKNCEVEVYDDHQLQEEGFGLLFGIGNSGINKPRFVFVMRKGKRPDAKVIAIAGKGITFDAGGLAIKDFANISDMKYDKIGAVYGATALLQLLENPDLDVHTIIGVFPLAENVISENALRPGDVITSYNKKTVEITNPDAEGRLVLADAFGFLEQFKPNLLIDVATLTGHSSRINCWHTGYFYTNNKEFKDAIEDITDKNGERMLAMPIWKDYDNILFSTVADYANSPVKCSDSFVAALFLKQFVPKHATWVHIDLAHEFSPGCAPKGNGIRTINDIVLYYHKKMI